MLEENEWLSLCFILKFIFIVYTANIRWLLQFGDNRLMIEQKPGGYNRQDIKSLTVFAKDFKYCSWNIQIYILVEMYLPVGMATHKTLLLPWWLIRYLFIFYPAAVYNIILSLYIANTLQTSRSWKSNVITYSKMINICKHIVDFLIHTIHNIRKTLEGWGYLSHIWVQSLIQIMLTFKWRIFKMGICITSFFNSKVSGANNTLSL